MKLTLKFLVGSVAMTFVGLLLLRPISAVPAQEESVALHGFVVYSQAINAQNNKRGVKGRYDLFCESLPDHRVKRLIAYEHSQTFMGNVGPVAVDATGSFVAFLADKEPTQVLPARRRLWILRLRDNALLTFLKGITIQNYQWAPNGSRLAVVVKTSSGTKIFLVDPIKGRSVSTGIDSPLAWAWSPDARSIAYVEGGPHQLCLFSLVAARTLFHWGLAKLSDATVCFSSPGELLVLQGQTLYQATVGRPLKYMSTLGETIEAGQAAVSPAGDRLALETYIYETSDDPLSALPLGVDRKILVYGIRAKRFKALRMWTNSATFFPPTDSILGWSRDGRFLIITHLPDDPKALQLQLLAISNTGRSWPLFTSNASISSLDWHEGR